MPGDLVRPNAAARGSSLWSQPTSDTRVAHLDAQDVYVVVAVVRLTSTSSGFTLGQPASTGWNSWVLVSGTSVAVGWALALWFDPVA